MNVDKYLERINYKGSTSPNLVNLKAIHKNHLSSIPFENLDIHSKMKIVLDQNSVEQKILNSFRGGYCYELNGLFNSFLSELGYNTKMVSARVNNGKGSWGEEFDHLAIIVELDELWLVDVGFGDSFLEPITLQLNKGQKNLNGMFKISKHDDDYLKMSKSPDDSKYEDEFIFTLKERAWSEFERMNNYHQTSPDSHFTRGKICSIAKEGGRVTLSDTKLIITNGERKDTTEIKNENDFNEKLYEYFKIKM